MKWLLLLIDKSLITFDLVAPALSGDKRSLSRLVDRLLPLVRAITRRVLNRWSGSRVGPHDGDDLVQEVWLRLFREDGARLRGFDPSRGMSFRNYIALVARTEAGQVLKREQAGKRGGGLEPVQFEEGRSAGTQGSPEEAAIARQSSADLLEHLDAHLGPKGKLVLRYIYGDGVSVNETAQAMGVKPQVVYNWQHKIRGLIRDHLAA